MNFIPTFWSIRYCIIAKKKPIYRLPKGSLPYFVENANETNQQLKDNYLNTT